MSANDSGSGCGCGTAVILFFVLGAVLMQSNLGTWVWMGMLLGGAVLIGLVMKGVMENLQ